MAPHKGTNRGSASPQQICNPNRRLSPPPPWGPWPCRPRARKPSSPTPTSAPPQARGILPGLFFTTAPWRGRTHKIHHPRVKFSPAFARETAPSLTSPPNFRQPGPPRLCAGSFRVFPFRPSAPFGCAPLTPGHRRLLPEAGVSLVPPPFFERGVLFEERFLARSPPASIGF